MICSFGTLHRFIDPLEKAQRGVAGLAAVEQIDVGIIIGRGRNGRPAERDDLARVVGAAGDVVNAMPLDVHARNENHVGPGEFFRRHARDVLIDEFDFPLAGNQRRDDQNALRRHEALHVAHERERVVERAEAVTVARKRAENAALVARSEIAQREGFRCFRRGQRFLRHNP